LFWRPSQMTARQRVKSFVIMAARVLFAPSNPGAGDARALIVAYFIRYNILYD
jgi:hypothetical protein